MILRCNKASQGFFDLRMREIVGQRMETVFAHAAGWESDEASRHMEDVFRCRSTEVQFPNKTGWFEVNNYPIGEPSHAQTDWVHVVEDITSRREREEVLLRLRAAVEQTAESVVIISPLGTIDYVNPAFSATTGYAEEDVVGSDLQRVGIGPVDRRLFRQIRGTLAKGAAWSGIYTGRRKDGSFFTEEAAVSPVRGSDGTIHNYIAVCRDVTDRKRYEAIADAVNMMENVGYVFSGIRHELGNPINSVKTALLVLELNVGVWSSEQIATYVARALSEIARVEYLLKALKTFSMFEHLTVEPLRLAPFLENFLSLVESDFAKRGIVVETLVDSIDTQCLADARALHQVLLNLISNAADALAGVANGVIRIRTVHVAGRVELHVTDNGRGIPDAQVQSLFKPFYTSKPQGTGLGLVIVKKMMAKMRGTVNVTSTVGRGTVVVLSFEAVNREA
jgi:PAS domain S-box-containing protein